MIYVPEKESYECYVVQSEGVIRSYEQTPTNNSIVNYRDYYINSSYIFRDGTQQFSNYATLPICLSNDSITSNMYYRLDFDKILVIVLIISIFSFWIPVKVFKRFFRRFC